MAKLSSKPAKPAQNAKPAPKTETDAPADGETLVAVTLKLRDLIDAAATRAGAKKAQTRPIIEAALALIGEALDRGEALNLPPLGKARVGRAKQVANGAMLTVKLKRGSAPRAGAKAKAPLADANEEG